VPATSQTQGLAGYRERVSELVRAGERFADVENAIDEARDLTMDQKAALWLLAFSLRDRDEQQRVAWAHVAAVD
jgi:hypothetical protein